MGKTAISKEVLSASTENSRVPWLQAKNLQRQINKKAAQSAFSGIFKRPRRVPAQIESSGFASISALGRATEGNTAKIHSTDDSGAQERAKSPASSHAPKRLRIGQRRQNHPLHPERVYILRADDRQQGRIKRPRVEGPIKTAVEPLQTRDTL